MFIEESKAWIWAWAMITNKLNDTYGSRNILLYGLDLDVY
jgi:hypothetical protein